MSRPVFASALILGAALTCAPGAANASASHVFAMSGQADHQLDCWENLDLCQPGLPPPPDVIYAWTGTLTIVLDTAVDGTFGNADLVSLDFSSNISSFSLPGGLGFFPLDASVTVANGAVTAFSGSYSDFPIGVITTTFEGLSASYFQPAQHHFGQTMASATLTELLPVPESDTWLLMLGGIGLATAARRRPFSRERTAAA